MRNYRSALRVILLSAALGVGALTLGHSASAQELFISDGLNNSVKQFNASSATYLGAFIASGADGLSGPRGMIFTDGQLVVVNQNLQNPISKKNLPGEILRFDAATGTFLGKLVASSDMNAPFAPRGIVRGGPDNFFYVADDGTSDDNCVNQGDVKTYDENGAFRGNLYRATFDAAFYPRGIVFGPDGLLYVSARGCPLSKDPSVPLLGYVLRFDPSTKAFIDVFASDKTVPHLHRPEGLVFDSAGNLWVTSFRASAGDSDRILKLNGKTGAVLDELALDVPGGPRAYAQAIIFGPDGNLFIPITGGDPTNSTTAGQVLRYNTTTKALPVIVPANSAGGPLQQPWYPIFRNSDPATLNYKEN
ncbi:Vgb family protein [Burkholderia sp. PU8-34]